MEHDLCVLSWLVLLISLTPVVAARIGENCSFVVEGCSSDWLTGTWISLQSVLGQSVPKVESSIATSCGKCTMFRVI